MEGIAEDGAKVDSIQNQPDLFFDAIPFWEAFAELSSSRQAGFDAGYIPYSEISAWLNENDIISLEERNRFRHFITFIDKIFIEKHNEQQEKKRKAQKAKKK